MRHPAAVALKVLLALCLFAMSFIAGGGASGSGGRSATVRKIGPGAYYKKIVDTKRKRVIHVITVKLAAPSTIDVGLAGDELGHVERVSSLAARKGAIAAINGDFGTRELRPFNVYAEDGNLIQTERTWGRALALDATESRGFIGHPRVRVKLSPNRGTPITIDRVNNGPPETDEIALHTRFGRVVEQNPSGACSAQLVKRGERTINAFGAASQRYEVVAVQCSSKPMKMEKGIVVSVRQRGSRRGEITSLALGQKARLTWSLTRTENVLDVMGGNPMIVENGRVLRDVVTGCGFLCEVHPRTAVGLTADNKLLLVVVDGRRKGVPGMSLRALARWFVNQGAYRAMNLDGGGASEMWIHGEVVNIPSDGQERPAVNALLLLPGSDADQPTVPVPTPTPTPSPTPTLTPTPQATTTVDSAAAGSSGLSEAVARETLQEAAADPASLGGLADFLMRRGVDVPPWLQSAARDLRATER